MYSSNITSVTGFIFWSIFAFIFLYAPPVIPYFHILVGLFIFAIMIVTFNRRYIEAYKLSNLSTWVKAMLGVFLYALLIPLPLSAYYGDIVDLPHYYHLFNRFAVLVFMEVIFGTFLLSRFRAKGHSFFYLIKVLIAAAIFQSFLGLLALMVPAIKDIFLSIMINVGGLSTEKEGLLYVRTFGFALSMLDQFGLGTGLIAGISFYIGVNYKSRYILYSLIIMIASVLNSRTGIVIYAIAIIITMAMSLFINRNPKMIIKSLAFIIFVPVLFFSVIEVVSQYNDMTGQWVAKGIESVFELLLTGSSNTDDMNIMSLERFWQLPDAAHILIGTGHSRYAAEGYLHTDCGIVNDIWFVGILGLLLLYGVVFYLCWEIYKDANTSLEKFVAIFFVGSFCAFDIKGATIGYNMGGAVFFLVIFATRFYQRISIDKEGLKII